MRDLRYAFNLSEDEDARPFSEVQMQVPFGSAQGRLSTPPKSASLRMTGQFFHKNFGDKTLGLCIGHTRHLDWRG
jgi:hypothetical protein